MQAFAFQSVRHESGIFRFECIKAFLRHGLSRHVEHEIEASDRIPYPLWWGIKCLPRGRLSLSNSLPPSSKRRQMPGVCPGGMFELRFDLYIMSQTEVSQSKIALNLADNTEKRSLLLFGHFPYVSFLKQNKVRMQLFKTVSQRVKICCRDELHGVTTWQREQFCLHNRYMTTCVSSQANCSQSLQSGLRGSPIFK